MRVEMGTQVDRPLAGRYRLGERLGRGGMAEVFDAVDDRLQRPVAVKVLRPEMAVNPDVRRRFEAEARNAARLTHPNVVSVYDTGEDHGVPFIVMERLPGETLADRMAAGKVDQDWLRRVVEDVLGALAAAHAAGIVHRDIKPGNVLLASDGCAKVADFGIAKAEEGAAGDATATNILLGTPAYLAPERLEGSPATPRSDLYSLGVLMFEALAGEKPAEGSRLGPDVAPDLAAATERAMSADPVARFPSAAAMAASLDSAAAADETIALDRTLVMPMPVVQEPVMAAAVPAPAPLRRRRLRRVPLAVLPALIAFAAGLLAVMLIAALSHHPSSPTSPSDSATTTSVVPTTTPPTTAAPLVNLGTLAKTPHKKHHGGGG
jgi:eukaryotic-like serine/threonine-protein kinase